jgi:hypothetical protein
LSETIGAAIDPAFTKRITVSPGLITKESVEVFDAEKTPVVGLTNIGVAGVMLAQVHGTAEV